MSGFALGPRFRAAEPRGAPCPSRRCDVRCLHQASAPDRAGSRRSISR